LRPRGSHSENGCGGTIDPGVLIMSSARLAANPDWDFHPVTLIGQAVRAAI
jgi:hypothetical protein